MRARLAIAALLAASGALTAQSAINTIGMWDRNTEFTSRASLSGNAGSLSQKHQYGVVAGITHLSQTQYVMQDQQASTQNPYDVGLTGTNNEGLPDYANTVFYATSIGLPSTTAGTLAWVVTHTFNTTTNPPIKVPQDMTGFHHVWRLKAEANWVTDGVSVHMSQAAAYNSTLLCYNTTAHREIPRSENNTQIVSELGWSEVPNGNPAANFVDRAWRLMVGADTPTLEGGAANTVYNCANQTPSNQGYASYDPDFADIGSGSPGRFDNPTFTITAGATYASGVGILFSSQALLPTPIPIFGGQFMLDPTDPMFGLIIPTTLNGSGAGTIVLNLGASNNPIRAALHTLPTWITQALVIQGSNVGLTNIFTMRLHKNFTNDPVFKNANLDSANPVNASKPLGALSIYVRNDGHGPVTLKQFAGSTQFPGVTTVGDYAAVRLPLIPATTTVRIETMVQKPTSQHAGVNIAYGFY